jgi:hypothetical protein
MIVHPFGSWHDDDGPVLWTMLPIEEAPWCGTPADSDWPFSPDCGPFWFRLPAEFLKGQIRIEAPAGRDADGGRAAEAQLRTLRRYAETQALTPQRVQDGADVLQAPGRFSVSLKAVAFLTCGALTAVLVYKLYKLIELAGVI